MLACDRESLDEFLYRLTSISQTFDDRVLQTTQVVGATAIAEALLQPPDALIAANANAPLLPFPGLVRTPIPPGR